MSKSKRILSILLVLAMIICCVCAFTACGENPEDTTVFFTDDPDLTEITFVLDWAPNTNHTGLYVAQQLGFYAEEGLKVNFVQPGTTGTSAMVAAGNGQFGIDFQEQMIWHAQNKVGVTAVAAIIDHNTSGIISQKSKGIDTAEKMAGHKYATWDMPGEQAIVRSMNSNIEMVPNTVENIVAEFQNPNGVDMVWSYAAWDKIILDQNKIENNFIYMRDIDVPGFGKVLDYYTPVIIVNNTFKTEHPELVKKFMKATARGYNFAIDNPRSAGYVLMKANPELCAARDTIYASQTYLANEYKGEDQAYWGQIDNARWSNFFTYMTQIKVEDKEGNLVIPTDENGNRIFPENINFGEGIGFTNEFLPGYTA